MPLINADNIPAPPPRATRAKPASKTPTPPPKEEPSKAASRTESLMEYAGIAQGISLMYGNYADAETIEMHARPFLSAVAKLGDVHPQFGDSIDKAQGLGPYFAVFAAAVPMAVQFMANHGRIDASRVRFGGIQDPSVLANRQSSKVADAQAQMIREQRIAAEQAMAAQQRLHDEMEAFQSLANSVEQPARA